MEFVEVVVVAVIVVLLLCCSRSFQRYMNFHKQFLPHQFRIDFHNNFCWRLKVKYINTYYTVHNWEKIFTVYCNYDSGRVYKEMSPCSAYTSVKSDHDYHCIILSKYFFNYYPYFMINSIELCNVHIFNCTSCFYTIMVQ